MSTDHGTSPAQDAVTPTETGPGADPALLAENHSGHAEQVGLNMALAAMQTYGRELVERQRKLQDVLSGAGGSTVKSGRGEERNQRGIGGATLALRAAIDMSNVAIPVKNVTETYIMSAFALGAIGVGIMAGRMLATPITMFLQPIGAALLAALIIPAFAAYKLDDAKLTYTATLALLGQLGAIQGVLMGAASGGVELSGEPFLFLSPVVASFAITTAAKNDRLSVLGITIGASMAVHVLVGLLGGLLGAPYFALSLLYSASLAVPIQIEAKAELAGNIGFNSSLLVGLGVAANALVYLIAGI